MWKRTGGCKEANYLYRADGGYWYVGKTPCKTGGGLRSKSKNSKSPFRLNWQYKENGKWTGQWKIQVVRKNILRGTLKFILTFFNSVQGYFRHYI